MPGCPKCGYPLWFDDDECPDCKPRRPDQRAIDRTGPQVSARSSTDGDALPEVDEQQIPIARFQSGAEAGYFCDELCRVSGYDVCVVTRERRDSIHSSWGIDFVLVASVAQARDAAAALKRLVDDSDDPDEACDVPADTAPERNRESTVGRWVPLALTLAAGSIACWGIEQVVARPQARVPALVDRDPRLPPRLWHILGSSPGPWIQKSPNEQGVRELTFDPRRQVLLLREDGDGDGHFEREWRFDSQPR